MYNFGQLIFEVLSLDVFTCFFAVVFVASCFLLVARLFKRG